MLIGVEAGTAMFHSRTSDARSLAEAEQLVP